MEFEMSMPETACNGVGFLPLIDAKLEYIPNTKKPECDVFPTRPAVKVTWYTDEGTELTVSFEDREILLQLEICEDLLYYQKSVSVAHLSRERECFSAMVRRRISGMKWYKGE